jgi:hypothetical protein
MEETNGRRQEQDRQWDRARVAAGQDYEVHHLAREAGVTTEQAQQLIKAYGNDREKLMQTARGLAKPNIRSSRI